MRWEERASVLVLTEMGHFLGPPGKVSEGRHRLSYERDLEHSEVAQGGEK